MALPCTPPRAPPPLGRPPANASPLTGYRRVPRTSPPSLLASPRAPTTPSLAPAPTSPLTPLLARGPGQLRRELAAVFRQCDQYGTGQVILLAKDLCC